MSSGRPLWWSEDPNVRARVPMAGSTSLRGLQTTFLCPQLIMGADSLKTFKWVAVNWAPKKRVLIITDSGVIAQAQRIAQLLEDVGFTARLWDKVVPEPPVEVVQAGAQVALEFEPDLLVAVGGGSVIDAAKIIWVLYESPGTDIRNAQNRYPLGLRKKARLAAIPTTAGTGSEATNAAVISEEDQKMFVIHNEIVPDVAVLDPALTVGLPPKLTAYTGMDVISHATGAFLSHWSNELLDAIALKAINMTFRFLPRAYANGHDFEARSKMLLAAHMGGLAFGNAAPGLDHAMGHAFGKIFHVHHGAAVGLFLPYTMGYLFKVSDKYVELAQSLGINASSDEEYQDKLLDYYLSFQRSIGAPTTIADLGISEEDMGNNLDELCHLSYADNGALIATRPVNPANFRKLFEYAYAGKKVDF